MKKSKLFRGLFYNSLRKTLRIMHFSTILLIIGILQLQAAEIYSQKARISLNLKEIKLSTALDKIEKESEFFFLYNEKLFDTDRLVSINANDELISDILVDLFAGTDVKYTIIDRKIILAPGYLTSKPDELTGLQERKITGTVSDAASGEPIIGATIVIDGTTIGTITDLDGKFSLPDAKAGSVIIVSYLGYKTERIAIGELTNYNIKLTSNVTELEEVVVVGYGTIKKSDFTGSVGSVKSSDIKSQGISNLTSSLQGKLSGVTIESGTGKPGAGNRILIRGVGTFGNSSPLYLVDGVPVSDIGNIPSSDIESINILKDASAAAIYGSRAANGVVLINTKNGTKGDPKIQFDVTGGLQTIIKKWDVLNAEEWANVSNAAHTAAGLPLLDLAKDPAALGTGTDWQDEIYHTAPIQQYQLGVSGANDVIKYSISGGFNNQKGIVKTTKYERYNLRLKTEVKKSFLRIGESLIVINDAFKNVPRAWSDRADAIGAGAIMIPAFSVYDPNAIGGYAGAYGPVVNIGNPLAQLNLEDNITKNLGIINNTFAEITFLKDLKYKLNFGYTRNFTNDEVYTRRYSVGTLFTNTTNNLAQTRGQNATTLIENTATYDKVFGDHSLQVLVGYTYQKYNYTYSYLYNTNLPDGIKVIGAAKGTPAIAGQDQANSLLSTLGRIVYSFGNRYLATFTFRRDGSSRFSEKNKYGYFPSIALGWNINNESFFTNSFLNNIFTTLKLRGSYGILGNQEIGNYLYAASISGNINYPIGINETKWSGAIQSIYATPDIRWETTKTINFGIDGTLIDNKLNATIDWFDKRTDDILLSVPIPLSTGSSTSPVVNAGTVRNKGLEISLNYFGKAGSLNYNIFGTATHINNRVVEMGTNTQQIFGSAPMLHAAPVTVAMAKGELGEFFLKKAIGIFQSDAEAAEYTFNGNMIQPNAKAGDIKFLDADNNGTINDGDRVSCGSAFPKLEYGFGFNASIHNFDLSLFFQGTAGNKIYNGMRQQLEGMTLEQNYSRSVLNAWTPENTNTDVPRAVINDPNYNSSSSSRFLENGSYLRIKTLQIGYSLPSNILAKLNISMMRVFMSGDNLLTFTKYTGNNPDLGGRGGILDRGIDFSVNSYPLARTVSFGLQLTF